MKKFRLRELSDLLQGTCIVNSGTRPWTQLFCLSANTISWIWILIGRTDAEAEAPILWSPDAKSWLIGKDPDTGKDWGQKKGMRCWMVSLTQWTCVCVCVCVCMCVWVTQLCLTPCDPMDCNLPGSSLHGILQIRTWVWANSRKEWSTGKPGLLQFMGTQLSNWKTTVFCTDRMNWEYSSGLSVLNGQKITQETYALPLPLPPHLIFSTK